MEHIKEALDKARASFDGPPSRAAGFTALKSIRAANRQDLPIWSPPQVDLDFNRLIEERIVSQTPQEPSHAAFNLLRTRVRKALSDNRWRTLAITSPTPGCGKTMISLNLAFSLARAPQCRTVLIDLDLRKPSVASTLNIESFGSIHRCLSGDIAARDVFVKVNENLILGLNDKVVQNSSELLQGQAVAGLLESAVSTFQPEVILIDLPPMSVGDDVLAILPAIDTTLLVAAAGATKTSEVDECESQLSNLDKLLGVVLNKSDPSSDAQYY